ncbi:hypothetical protein CVIRNUC_006683 [Coccomyxa viridis]|uniref:Uncharacterized protein n=1 Tax=Coccomyxa viridis TaxID=1274662 RepID=A0AAV1IBZ7_9CHLO|nr:hypothetical protein CVIRNUC_006683 [Coccomyxa viridis]
MRKKTKVSSARSQGIERKSGKTVDKATEGAVIADARMSGNQLPMEVWRQVALRMSTREMAKGLAKTCKALRHLSTSAICLSSGSDDAIDWARKRWVLATKLCLKTSRATDSRLMSWVAFNSKELGSLSQLDIITDAHITAGRHHAAAAVAAMASTLALQNLKHLTVALSLSTTSDFMWTCLGQLSELRTLDLKLICAENSVTKRLVDLSKLKKLERLRLANVTSSALLVRPQCKIAVKQWGYSALPSPVSTSADYDIHMATWVLKTNITGKWPEFHSSLGSPPEAGPHSCGDW